MIYLQPNRGGLAQLARALAWHARGHRFDSDILHSDNQGFTIFREAFFLCDKTVIKQKTVKINLKCLVFSHLVSLKPYHFTDNELTLKFICFKYLVKNQICLIFINQIIITLRPKLI